MLILALALTSVAALVIEVKEGAAIALYFLVALLLSRVAAKGRWASPIDLLVVAYLFGYPVMAILIHVYPEWSGFQRLAETSLDSAMLWSLRAFGALAVGYILVDLLAGESGLPTRALRPNQVRRAQRLISAVGIAALAGKILSLAAFGIGLTFIEQEEPLASPGLRSVQMVLELLEQCTVPFIAGAVLLRLQKLATPWVDRILKTLLIFVALDIITIGSKAAIIWPILGFLLALVLGRRSWGRRELLLGAASVAGVYMSFAVITEYRQLMRAAYDSGQDVFELRTQASLFGEATLASVPYSEWSSSRKSEVTGVDVLSRLGAALFSFANLLEHTDGQPPHEHPWKSLLLPAYAVLPRALVDKPTFFDSGMNAQRYYGWSYGGISVSTVGSFYYAWGYAGIIVGMACLGGLLARIHRGLDAQPLLHPARLIVFVVLVRMTVDVGVTFQAAGIVIVRMIFLVWMLSQLTRVGGSHSRRGSHLRAVHPQTRREEST